MTYSRLATTIGRTGLTSVFGMVTGVSPRVLSPHDAFYVMHSRCQVKIGNHFSIIVFRRKAWGILASRTARCPAPRDRNAWRTMQRAPRRGRTVLLGSSPALEDRLLHRGHRPLRSGRRTSDERRCRAPPHEVPAIRRIEGPASPARPPSAHRSRLQDSAQGPSSVLVTLISLNSIGCGSSASSIPGGR